MRNLLLVASVLGASFAALALSPLPDRRPQFFAGEWVGLGEMNTLCWMSLVADGSGRFRGRAPNGTVVDVAITHWENVNQSLSITAREAKLEVRNQMNGVFSVGVAGMACQMSRRAELEGWVKASNEPVGKH